MLGQPVRIVCLLLLLNTIASAQSAVPDADKKPAVTETTADPSDSMEQPLLGDHWTYEVHDEITGNLKFTTTNLITDVTNTDISIRTENLGVPGVGFLVYDRNWNLKSSPTWKYSPNDGTGIRLPAKAGTTWKFQSNDLYAQRGISFQRTGSSKIVAEESVTTAAGTFNTFKIETSINARNANDPTKKFEFAMTTWYAPRIDHWVKRISKTLSEGHVSENTSYELGEYGRR